MKSDPAAKAHSRIRLSSGSAFTASSTVFGITFSANRSIWLRTSATSSSGQSNFRPSTSTHFIENRIRPGEANLPGARHQQRV
jgi:hypothetical protein